MEFSLVIQGISFKEMFLIFSVINIGLCLYGSFLSCRV
jgi:hypothetical protein